MPFSFPTDQGFGDPWYKTMVIISDYECEDKGGVFNKEQ